MKIYKNENVYDAALRRIGTIFDEFENIMISFSGGKDSTVTLQLALRVAEERARLPLPVMFLDQEAEWDTVIRYVRKVMSDPRVTPVWVQVPIKIFNATSNIKPWLNCWEIGKENEWIRPKEPNSIKENTFGTDRFTDMFRAFGNAYFKGKPYAYLGGVRCEESAGRFKGLTIAKTYKWITWGKVEDKSRDQYVFYPLYDWSFTDIWKAIHDNGWPYCRLYDLMYQYGIPAADMRVSNVHHETAVRTLYYLQEIEADTWNRITKRISGLNTAKTLQNDFLGPKKLPFMFKDWKEYRDYLLENLIVDPEIREKIRKIIVTTDERFTNPKCLDDLVKTQIKMILKNDYHGTTMSHFLTHWMRFNKNSKWYKQAMNDEKLAEAKKCSKKSGKLLNRLKTGRKPSQQSENCCTT